jgi:hypothetical protein
MWNPRILSVETKNPSDGNSKRFEQQDRGGGGAGFRVLGAWNALDLTNGTLPIEYLEFDLRGLRHSCSGGPSPRRPAQ